MKRVGKIKSKKYQVSFLGEPSAGKATLIMVTSLRIANKLPPNSGWHDHELEVNPFLTVNFDSDPMLLCRSPFLPFISQ
jgi:ABC-type polysaccharide/polyol phosphate transport system ATPase subunit